MGVRRKIALIGLALTSIGGLVFSGLLYHQSVLLAAGVQGPKTCHVAEGFSCDPALASDWASLFGIPLPALSAAYYFHLLAILIGIALAKKDREETIKKMGWYFFAMTAMSTIFSIFLAYIIFFLLPMTCPFCLGIHGVNIASLVLVFVLGPQLKEGFGAFAQSAKSVLATRALHGALLTFIVFLIALTASYKYGTSWLKEKSNAEQRAKGEAAAESLTLQGDNEIDLSGLPMKGRKDAPITLVEFSDFECPFCVRFAHTANEIYEKYPDHVRVFFAHYPLDGTCNPRSGSMHPNACKMALGSVCAQAQDKFWPFHDQAFDFFQIARANGERPSVNNSTLIELAKKSDLDIPTFKACIDDPKSMGRVVDQVKLGFKLNLRSVPTWTLNGHLESGAAPFAYVQPLVEKLIELHEKGEESPALEEKE